MASTWSYYFDTGRHPNAYTDKYVFAYFEHSIERAAIEFNKESEYISVSIFTLDGLRLGTSTEALNDL